MPEITAAALSESRAVRFNSVGGGSNYFFKLTVTMRFIYLYNPYLKLISDSGKWYENNKSVKLTDAAALVSKS